MSQLLTLKIRFEPLDFSATFSFLTDFFFLNSWRIVHDHNYSILNVSYWFVFFFSFLASSHAIHDKDISTPFFFTGLLCMKLLIPTIKGLLCSYIHRLFRQTPSPRSINKWSSEKGFLSLLESQRFPIELSCVSLLFQPVLDELSRKSLLQGYHWKVSFTNKL